MTLRQFWIDRGGTFTDCIGHDPATGEFKVIKLLSTDRAPLEGIRKLLDLAENQPIPECSVRLGTTVATNALLERRGAPCALATTRGFADLLVIGDQTRPELFAVDIEKPKPLTHAVLEIDARAEPSGAVLERPDPEALSRNLTRLRAQGIESLAIVVIHDLGQTGLEHEIAVLARSVGFTHIVTGHELSHEVGFLARTETAVIDAYLTPLLRGYVELLERELPGSKLWLMQSSGALTDSSGFRAPNAILSGPAGGVVACARVAAAAGFQRVIGFDMGGTSTDVSRFDGDFDLVQERQVAGIRVRAPSLSVHTVAAGGGSICRFDGTKLVVGPESAGAFPGPLCYGQQQASSLTITDLNLVLGRLIPDRFPFPLDIDRPREALARMSGELVAAGHAFEPEELAHGFLEVANLHMAQAIRQVSVQKGYDPRNYALMVFGGAGGQHACAVARRLGIQTILIHPLAGVLSAYGIGIADIGWHGAREVRDFILGKRDLANLETLRSELETEGRAAVARHVDASSELTLMARVDLRYAGSETAITLPWETSRQLLEDFERRHLAEFGHVRPVHEIELVALRMEVRLRRPPAPAPEPRLAHASAKPTRLTRVFFDDGWHKDVPVFERENLNPEHTIFGPALIVEATGTIVVEPGFTLRCTREGLISLEASSAAVPRRERALANRADPVTLEIMGHAFMSIAEQMGEVLRRTALSTDIRERLDFSCAVFDAQGALVANAPHIPVHLGAMSESVRAVLDANTSFEPGDVFVTNDPARGGSHLPDVTLVAPVHDENGIVRYFVANRGHHADIGGITPGSMPAFSQTLTQEGVVFSGFRIVEHGRFLDRAVLEMLSEAPYPARRPQENLADLAAQLAALKRGAALLHEFENEHGTEVVARYMRFIQDDAALRVGREIAALGSGSRRFVDALDDGTPIQVELRIEGQRAVIDFTGTGPQVTGNLNAPRAVTVAAVMYFLRTLVGHPIPLNSGCLRQVELLIPRASILDPDAGRAVAGGNVETSQRVVDVLFAAAGRAAASQGTMNNLSFGNESFGYYETICGGAGAGPGFAGASAVHTHMTNTRITDPEILERRFPVRLLEFSVRRNSGGRGRFRGGDGVCREFEFLAKLEVSLLSERRSRAPFGLSGGEPGSTGRASLNGVELPSKFVHGVAAGDRLRIETPGGGGFGSP